MYQKKLRNDGESSLQEMLWGTGSLARLQKQRHKLIFRIKEVQNLVRCQFNLKRRLGYLAQEY
jgi:hypothetical protein